MTDLTTITIIDIYTVEYIEVDITCITDIDIIPVDIITEDTGIHILDTEVGIITEDIEDITEMDIEEGM